MPKPLALATWTAIATLGGAVLVFAGIRFATDVPHLVGGTTPDPLSFEAAYVANPALAYLHIVPGILFLVGAVFQLSRRFRSRHLALHRRFGRVVLACGLTSGVFALAFGIPFAFGGTSESIATAVFATWFLVALLLAYRAIRRRDIDTHRRWMIRAFAVGLGVGSIRVWTGLLSGFGPVSFADGLAWAFWIGLSSHVLVGELWLLARPTQSGRRRGSLVVAAE